MNRRNALGLLGTAAIQGAVLQSVKAFSQEQAGKADFTIRIEPVSVELAPHRIVKTTGYNGRSPGPLLRIREGQMVTLDVYNETDAANPGALARAAPVQLCRDASRYSLVSHACAGRPQFEARHIHG
jgi:FtsP/CotA-like multicopper oxidase with cupredoxin domain